MSLTLGVVMDPIESITPYKDTTLAMMLAASARGWTIHSIDQADIYLDRGRAFAKRRKVAVYDDNNHWFDAEDLVDAPLSENDIILMRKDPPFDMDYIYTTYLLERAASEGVLVSNRPGSLRDVNEKLYTAWFNEYCPPTLVTASATRLKGFVQHHKDAIIKPLDGMGGAGIFRLTPEDPNINIILEQSTRGSRRQIMAQRYVPEIKDGDKRVLVVNGQAVPFALARIPAQGETRGNLAAGGRGVPVALGEAEQRIVEAVSPHLLERGLLFVGLDIIGSYLTEINVTSPTCARELDAHMQAHGSGNHRYSAGISNTYLDALEGML
jgi:glutathione synthase